MSKQKVEFPLPIIRQSEILENAPPAGDFSVIPPQEIENNLNGTYFQLTENAPLVTELTAIFAGGKDNLEKNKERVSFILCELKKMEMAQNFQKEQEALTQKLLEEFRKSSYWNQAKNIVDAVAFSTSYLVDIAFHPNETLKSKNISIRAPAKQGRHITPVALIERIILSSLQEGAQIDEILPSLHSKIEIFKLNLTQKDENYIQGIFDFFKHPNYRTSSGISLLIKIIAHFYNKKAFLSMHDQFIKIPYKIKHCYLIPTLKFGGTKFLHNEEGSLINGLLKILDGLENLCHDEKKLSDNKKKYMFYAIFATFDYLPLPKGAKNAKIANKQPNPNKHRYVGEDIHRLYQVTASHLHFIFETYPNLSFFYKKEIMHSFLKYVAFGVSEEDLCQVFKCKNLAAVGKKIKLREENLTAFTNAGKACGFFSQYKKIISNGNKKENFLNLLTQKVKTALYEHNAEYLFELEPQHEVNLIRQLKHEKLEKYFEKLAIKLLFKSFEKDNMLERLNCNPEEINLPIKVNVFTETFKHKIIHLLYQTKDKLSETCNAFLNNYSENAFYHNDTLFQTCIANLQKDNSYFLNGLIKRAIATAYQAARKDSEIPITTSLLNTLRGEILLLQKTKNPSTPEKTEKSFHSPIRPHLRRENSFTTDDTYTETDSSFSASFSSPESSPYTSPISQVKKRKLCHFEINPSEEEPKKKKHRPLASNTPALRRLTF